MGQVETGQARVMIDRQNGVTTRPVNRKDRGNPSADQTQ